jgi:AraC-like DNA-binding protein
MPAVPVLTPSRPNLHHLLESLHITVRDFRCRQHQHDQEGPEETVSVPSIVLIRRGVFRRSWRGKSRVIDANHLLFFNPGEPYRYAHPLAGGDDCTILELPDALARDLIQRHVPAASLKDGQLFPWDHALASRRAVRLHYELLRLIRQGAQSLSVEDTLSHLIGEVLESSAPVRGNEIATGSESARRRRELTEETKLLLNRSLEAPPSLSSIADELACSPFHLSRIFRTTVGVTLRQYLGRLRARAVARHLSEHATDLTRLALGMGYADHSHLTNAFRQEFGVPPSIFRAAALAE